MWEDQKVKDKTDERMSGSRFIPRRMLHSKLQTRLCYNFALTPTVRVVSDVGWLLQCVMEINLTSVIFQPKPNRMQFSNRS